MVEMLNYKFIFNVSINNEPAIIFESKNGLYNQVALEAFNKLLFTGKDNGEVKVQLWQDGLLHKTGKVTYLIKDGKAILLKQ